MIQNIKDILKYTFTSMLTLVALVIFIFVMGIDIVTAVFLTVILGAVLYYLNARKSQTRTTKDPRLSEQLSRVSPEKEQFYKEKGLSKEEMEFFRHTVNQARIQILTIEHNSRKNTKLQAILFRNDTLSVLKDFFRNIVKQPERLHEVDKFLYTHLPSLNELMEKHLDIDSHVAKTKETYQALDASAETIDEMCRLISSDYIHFMSNDLEDLDVEIELAKQVLKRDNKKKEEAEELLHEEL